MIYTIESVIVEKFEIISSKNITTTRARDFYDLYMLYHLYKDKVDKGILREAIERTNKHRDSVKLVSQHKEMIDLFKISGIKKTYGAMQKTLIF
jgi:abortive infection protein abiGII